MQFNEKLKQLRLEKGYSQAELAKRIFVSRSAVAKWENGLGLPSEQSLKLLSECLGEELSTFFPKADTAPATASEKPCVLGWKRWMILLAILLPVAMIAVAAILLPLALRSHSGIPGNGMLPVGDVLTRELIFETETEMDTASILSYPDDELYPEREFASSRIFAPENDSVVLPRLLVKQTLNGIVTFHAIDAESLSFFTPDEMRMLPREDGRIHIGLYAPGAPEYVGCANIRYGSLTVSVKLVRSAVPVREVYISPGDGTGEVGLTRSKPLCIQVFPENASYPACRLEIDRIERPDGEVYQGDLSQYAFLVHGSLQTTAAVEPGSNIYLSAVTETEQVRSNSLVIRVERIAVERIFFQPEASVSRRILSGESLVNLVRVEPPDATVCVRNEPITVSLLTPELGTLVQNGEEWILTASGAYSAVGQSIGVSVSTSDGYTEQFDWEIAPVAIRSIRIVDAGTGAELAPTTVLNPGATLQLSVIVSPENASYDRINYNLYADLPNFGAYVSVSDDGVLTVSERAPDGMVVYLSATFGHNGSPGYCLVIQATTK